MLALLARLAHAKQYKGQILSYKSWVYVDKFVFDTSGRGKPCTLHLHLTPETLNPKPQTLGKVMWEIKMHAAEGGDKVESGLKTKKTCSSCEAEFNGTKILGGCDTIRKLNR